MLYRGNGPTDRTGTRDEVFRAPGNGRKESNPRPPTNRDTTSVSQIATSKTGRVAGGGGSSGRIRAPWLTLPMNTPQGTPRTPSAIVKGTNQASVTATNAAPPARPAKTLGGTPPSQPATPARVPAGQTTS